MSKLNYEVLKENGMLNVYLNGQIESCVRLDDPNISQFKIDKKAEIKSMSRFGKVKMLGTCFLRV